MPQDSLDDSASSHIKHVPAHESPVRRLFSDVHQLPYTPLHTLEEAKAYPDGIMIFESNDGDQIYLTVPAWQVMCSEESLLHLLDNLDEIAEPNAETCRGHIYYERRPAGSGIAGGMGGGAVTGDLWLHQRIATPNLTGLVRDVLKGARTEIPSEIILRNVSPPPDKGIALSDQDFHDRFVTAVERTIEDARRDVADPLSYDHRLCLRMKGGKQVFVTTDGAIEHLSVDHTFPRRVFLTVYGVHDDHTMIRVRPTYGRRFVHRVDGSDLAPFVCSRVVGRGHPPISLVELEKMYTCLSQNVGE